MMATMMTRKATPPKDAPITIIVKFVVVFDVLFDVGSTEVSFSFNEERGSIATPLVSK